MADPVDQGLPCWYLRPDKDQAMELTEEKPRLGRPPNNPPKVIQAAKPGKTPAIKEETPMPPVKPPNPEGLVIELDFTDHPDMYDQIHELAEEQLRTPANQVLFILKQVDKRGQIGGATPE